jgi:sortase A
LLAQLKSAGKTNATPTYVEDPAWVGLAPSGEPEVLPDFPIPEPTNVAPDENGDLPDTSPVNRIILPSIGTDTVVKYVPYDGFTWLIAGLQQEIAWMGDTSWPGLGGNTGLAGHVSLRNGRDGPFRYLDQLVPNDEITLYTEENVYIYRVREIRQVTDTDFSVIEPTDNPQITLITCINWDAGTGMYSDRLVVFADLIGVTPITEISVGGIW